MNDYKKLIIFSLIALTLGIYTSPLMARTEEIHIQKIPTTVEEFISFRDANANSPGGGAAVYILALMTFSKNNQLGMQCLTIALDQSNVVNGDVYKGKKPGNGIMYHVNRMNGYKRWSYLGFAYTEGALASNNYNTDKSSFKVVSTTNKYSGSEEDGQVKVFIEVDGFMKRPIILKRNDSGVWKALNVSSMFLDLKKPANQIEKDDL